MESVVNLDPRTEVIENYMALSAEFQELHLYGKAEDTLLLALEKLPDSAELMSSLSNLYLSLDMPEKALTVTNKLVRKHADLGWPYYLRGKIHEKRQQPREAIREYSRALERCTTDRAVLDRLLPLAIEQGRAEQALGLIKEYQSKLNKPFAFSELQAEAYLTTGQHAAAFTKMREALRVDPLNAILLKRYLQLSIQIGKKTPSEVYDVLNLTLPNLVSLKPLQMLSLETDYCIYHQQFEEAFTKVDSVLKDNPADYFWLKKRAILKLESGAVEESIPELKTLFLERPVDIETRNILENYYLVIDQVDEWKQVLKEALKHQPDQFELFRYLRMLGNKTDWMHISELEHHSFVKMTSEMDFDAGAIHDRTFTKLPSYAMEIFVSEVAIHNRVPKPSELWKSIYFERQKKQQIPPFQREDLEDAYPIWLFALHVYFLFRTYSSYRVSFNPGLFSAEQIALTLHADDYRIQVDVSFFLGMDDKRRKTLIKQKKCYKWRWRIDDAAKAQMPGNMTLMTKNQFRKITAELESGLSKMKNNSR